jgi:hypothetical protein
MPTVTGIYSIVSELIGYLGIDADATQEKSKARIAKFVV